MGWEDNLSDEELEKHKEFLKAVEEEEEEKRRREKPENVFVHFHSWTGRLCTPADGLPMVQDMLVKPEIMNRLDPDDLDNVRKLEAALQHLAAAPPPAQAAQPAGSSGSSGEHHGGGPGEGGAATLSGGSSSSEDSSSQDEGGAPGPEATANGPVAMATSMANGLANGVAKKGKGKVPEAAANGPAAAAATMASGVAKKEKRKTPEVSLLASKELVISADWLDIGGGSKKKKKKRGSKPL